MNWNETTDNSFHTAIYGPTATGMGSSPDDSAYISINDSGCVVSMCSDTDSRFGDWMEKQTGLTLLITSRETANNIVGKPLSLPVCDIILM